MDFGIQELDDLRRADWSAVMELLDFPIEGFACSFFVAPEDAILLGVASQ
jgi:hypothetical protein